MPDKCVFNLIVVKIQTSHIEGCVKISGTDFDISVRMLSDIWLGDFWEKQAIDIELENFDGK